MKKLIAMLLALAMVLSLAACGGKTEAPAATEAPATEAAVEMTAAEKAAAEAEIRYALALLLDRNYIVEEITQAGQLPASSFVPMGLTDADGSQFYENAGPNADFNGYYNVAKEAFEANYAEAYEILCKYYEVDENGNRITESRTDADGKAITVDVTRPLTDEEKAARQAHINVFEACIEGFANDTVPKSTFDEEAEKVYAYGENEKEGKDGYYFNANSAFTREFSEVYSEVVDKAAALSVGSVGVVEYTAQSEGFDKRNGFVGKVYIYRVENEDKAYENVTSPFFADFYKIASYYLTLRMANDNMEKAEFGSKWQNINVLTHKYTFDYSIG